MYWATLENDDKLPALCAKLETNKPTMIKPPEIHHANRTGLAVIFKSKFVNKIIVNNIIKSISEIVIGVSQSRIDGNATKNTDIYRTKANIRIMLVPLPSQN
jgi:hypothetical protein